MQVKKHYTDDTTVIVSIVPNAQELSALKEQTLEHFSHRHAKIPGFREGKAPLAIVEKNIDPQQLGTEFIDNAVNQLYQRAIESENLKPISQPSVQVKKFVPFSDLEVEFTMEVLGEIKLADYKNIKLEKKAIPVTAEDITEVLKSLQTRSAEKKEVTRAAKIGDEVLIDFSGTNAKNGQTVKGADGKNYPLILGSNSFIPGFEDELIGLKPGAEKTFDTVFPDNYGVSALQGKKVTFKVTVNKVSEMSAPKIDDAFAAQLGPFKTLKELKDDIKKQLKVENETKADRVYENELLGKISELSTVPLPKKLVDEQLLRAEEDERQNLTYRGQTWQEHLDEEGVTEEEHHERNRPGAEQVVKAGLVLSEIAELEKIQVTPEEIELRLQLLKGQYPDQQMQSELDKPENKQTIANQLATEKTFHKLTEYASKKKE